MKKLVAVLLAVSLLAAYAVPVSAAETSGKCGDNLTYTVNGDVVYISGTGPMYDYSPENPSPLAQMKGTHYFSIQEGVTSIGDYAFAADTHGYYYISIAKSVTEVGHKAFANHRCRVTFLGNPPVIAEDACEGGSGWIKYIAGWGEEDIKSYGGTHKWEKQDVLLTPQTKMVYSLNEEIKPADFLFRFREHQRGVDTFSPPTVELGEYDNSTCGEKTVKVRAYDMEFTHTYFVTDGTSHLDSVEVESIGPQYYIGTEIEIEPVVQAGNIVLTKDVHYTLSYKNNLHAGSDAEVTVTGMGDWAGFSKTLTFRILRRDISQCKVGVNSDDFAGEPLDPYYSISYQYNIWGNTLVEGEDYLIYYQNNINKGKGSYCVVGIGDYCGYVTGEFAIETPSKEYIDLKGAFNGYASGELNDEIYYEEAVVLPGEVEFKVDSSQKYYAVYELYRVEGEDVVLVTRQESQYVNKRFNYDFTSVYEDAAEEGGAVYILSYAWVDSTEKVYSGMYVMAVPAKVSDATTMVVELVEGNDDFRRAYLCAYGLDGNVGKANWTTSDSSVATVNDGVVTFKKPGTVTITAQYGDLSDSVDFIVTADDLSQCEILYYDPQTGKADISYNDCQLSAGTDYILTVSEDAGVVTVTATGCGLFTGQISRQFNAEREPLAHTHSFDGCEDATCGTCAYQRVAGHVLGDRWVKNQTHHYHVCAACGMQKDKAEHTFSAEDDTVCTVCGPLQTPGDLNADYTVNEDDAIYLLQHILLPEFFPITQAVDYNGDHKVDEDDAIYLLQHVLLPEYFPL